MQKRRRCSGWIAADLIYQHERDLDDDGNYEADNVATPYVCPPHKKVFFFFSKKS